MGLKPTTELLINAFTLSRFWPEDPATLTWHFAVLLVLFYLLCLWQASEMAPAGPAVFSQPRERHRTIVLQGGNWKNSLMRKLVFYV